jgi:hypothetical protein
LPRLLLAPAKPSVRSVRREEGLKGSSVVRPSRQRLPGRPLPQCVVRWGAWWLPMLCRKRGMRTVPMGSLAWWSPSFCRSPPGGRKPSPTANLFSENARQHPLRHNVFLTLAAWQRGNRPDRFFCRSTTTSHRLSDPKIGTRPGCDQEAGSQPGLRPEFSRWFFGAWYSLAAVAAERPGVVLPPSTIRSALCCLCSLRRSVHPFPSRGWR